MNKSRWIRRTAVILSTTAVMIALAGCSPEAGAAGDDAGDDGTLKIGFADPIAANSYMQAMSAAAQATVEAAGGQFIARDAGLDPNQQVTDIEQFVNADVDAIIVPMPPVYEAIVPALEAAKKAGIVVIGMNIDMSYSEDAPAAPLDAQIIEDRRVSSTEQVAYLTENLPDGGRVLYVGGPAPTPAILSAEEEFKSALAEHPEFKVANTVNNMTDDIAGAKPLVDAALAADSGIVAIVAYNDPSAVGAAQAAADAGRDDLIILGLQAQPEGVAAVADGDVTATWDLHVVETGSQLAKLAIKAAGGEEGWQKTYITNVTRYDSGNIGSFTSWDEQIAALR